jgi:NAD(P)-dependent dehydrogenase (short-subunit alcohol dehydrogenase family)
MSWSTDDMPDLSGKVAVVTGANGGLGLASAKALAGKGAHVVMAARDQAKAADAFAEIRAAHPDASLEIVELDLGSLASVDAAAETIAAAHQRLDILMCNAGVMALPQGVTEDGFDTQMGINVLGHWVLISRLLPLVVATPGSRIVTLSSTAQHTGRAIDPADPHMRKKFDEWRMYGQTKLAMRHLAVGLQQRFDAAGVDAKALSAQPGFTNSDLQTTTQSHGSAGLLGAISEKWVKLTGMSTDRGALSQLRAATDPDAPGGGFYGPLFATNGPPVRKPLVRPGSDAAIDILWRVATAETGATIELAPESDGGEGHTGV